MQESEQENDFSIAPGTSHNSTGGLAFGGSFGQDSLAPSTAVFLYLSKINPNLMGMGMLLVLGLFGVNAVVSSLGKANPNNSLLATQQIQATAYQESLTATAELAQTVAKQKPGCTALVCIYSNPPSQEEAQPKQPTQPQYPDYYQSISAQASTTQFTPTNPDFWRYQWQHDRAYVNEWISACQAQEGFYRGWNSPECQALSQAMN